MSIQDAVMTTPGVELEEALDGVLPENPVRCVDTGEVFSRSQTLERLLVMPYGIVDVRARLGKELCGLLFEKVDPSVVEGAACGRRAPRTPPSCASRRARRSAPPPSPLWPHGAK